MSFSYDIVNRISSLGFCEFWRAQCVRNLSIGKNSIVADLMFGTGECWPYIEKHIGTGGQIVSVDFSPPMCGRQKVRLERFYGNVTVYCENALSLSLASDSIDFIVSAFGLKTFDGPMLDRFALETFRVLRPGGSCSLMEISLPTSTFLRIPYVFYINAIIPLIGRIFLKNIECYRMLGVYTEAFGSCFRIVEHFKKAGFEVSVKTHFFGCATSIIATKSGELRRIG